MFLLTRTVIPGSFDNTEHTISNALIAKHNNLADQQTEMKNQTSIKQDGKVILKTYNDKQEPSKC